MIPQFKQDSISIMFNTCKYNDHYIFMARKGRVSEIFSNALYHDNPNLYLIGYIDLGKIKETTLPEFLKLSKNFEIIPASRISYIKKENLIIYSKFKNRKEFDQTKSDFKFS